MQRMSVLCGVIVVGLYGLELKVDKVLRVEGTLVRDFGLCLSGGVGGTVKVDVTGETGSACGGMQVLGIQREEEGKKGNTGADEPEGEVAARLWAGSGGRRIAAGAGKL